MSFYHRSSSFGSSCINSNFQNHSTFPSGRKVMTGERKKKERKKKLTYENNGHLSFPVTRLPKPTLVPIFKFDGFQNHCTFPSGRKVITLQKKKLTYENNGHWSFPVKRLPKPTLVPIALLRVMWLATSRLSVLGLPTTVQLASSWDTFWRGN